MLPSTIIIITILIIFLIIITSKYTKENDIKTFNIKKSEVNDPNEIVKRLHELLIYKKEKVLWPFTLLSSMISSLALLYIFDRLTIKNYIICVFFLFLTIELPRRWTNTHSNVAQSSEASQLLGKYNYIQDKIIDR
jgi:hypothetical protein